MTNEEFIVNLTESNLNTLIRLSKQKLVEISKDVLKDLEPIENTSIFSLDEINIEVLKDTIDDMTYYLDLLHKLSITKNNYILETNI